MGLQTAEEVHDVYDAEKDDAGKFTVGDLKEGGTVIDSPTANDAAAPGEPTEREKVLAAIDKTGDEEVAALALDAARDTDFYAEAEAAFKAKFGT